MPTSSTYMRSGKMATVSEVKLELPKSKAKNIKEDRLSKTTTRTAPNTKGGYITPAIVILEFPEHLSKPSRKDLQTGSSARETASGSMSISRKSYDTQKRDIVKPMRPTRVQNRTPHLAISSTKNALIPAISARESKTFLKSANSTEKIIDSYRAADKLSAFNTADSRKPAKVNCAPPTTFKANIGTCSIEPTIEEISKLTIGRQKFLLTQDTRKANYFRNPEFVSKEAAWQS